MMIKKDLKINNKVLIKSHKDNTNSLAIDKTGTIKAIDDYDGTIIYFIHMDENIDGFPSKALKIPIGYGYLAIYEELILIG
jgi:hypothetical protein